MSGRRGNYRYGFINTEGTLRVVRDVTVQRGRNGEFVAITGERAAVGERLMLERVMNGAAIAVEVQVMDSRPVAVGGSIRHRLRLKPVGERSSRNEHVADEASLRSR